jgi:hypothetical protein
VSTWNHTITTVASAGVYYFLKASDGGYGGGMLRADFSIVLPPDTVPPVVTVSGAASSYPVDARVAVTASAADDRDGPLTPTCALAKEGVVDPVSTSCAIDADAWSLGTGSYTFTATATDAAGNTATTSATFDVVATYASVRNLTLAWTKKASVAKDLVSILDSAYAAEQRGQFTAEANKLKEYRTAVKAQSGKAIDADKADLLITFSHGL